MPVVVVVIAMLLFVLLTINAITQVDPSSPNDVVSLIVLPTKITVYDYVDYFEQVVFWCVVNPSVMENPLQVLIEIILFCVYLQWNLRVEDTLGSAILAIVGRKPVLFSEV